MRALEKHIEKIQNYSEETKKKIMWVGVPIVMFIVISFWLSYSDLSFKQERASSENQEVSKFEIFKNGFKVSFEEIKNLINNFKEKIEETNSFNIEAPKDSAQTEQTAEIKDVLENIESTTINNN